MTTRKEKTEMLARLTEAYLDTHCDFWAPEVTFDKNSDQEVRIDYVGFRAKRIHMAVSGASPELGSVYCLEIKSCLNDYNSGYGLNFIGDRNYLVTVPEVAEIAKERGILLGVEAILVPNSKGTALRKFKTFPAPYAGRMKTAGEVLYQMALRMHKQLERKGE